MVGNGGDEDHDPNGWPFTYGGGIARVTVPSMFSDMMLERLENLVEFLRSARVQAEDAASKVDEVIHMIRKAKTDIAATLDPLREPIIRNSERLACNILTDEKFMDLLADWRLKVKG